MLKRLFFYFFFISINFAQGPISVDLDEINFGLIAPGETTTQQIVISNSSSELISLDIISPLGYVFSDFSPVNVPSYGSSIVDINFSPPSAGTIESSLQLSYFYQDEEYILEVDFAGSAYTSINGGEVFGTWSRNISPIIVHEDILVPAGESLNIEPGVIIYFENLKSFLIEGNLIAIGNYNDIIKFTALNEGEYWNGIEFMDSDENNLEYVKIDRVLGDSFLETNLMDPNYWNCNAQWGGNSFYATNDGTGASEVTCTLKYPIINNADSINVQFDVGGGQEIFGNLDIEVDLYSDDSNINFINCGGYCSGQYTDIYLSDYFDIGEFVNIRVYLLDNASQNGTSSPQANFYNLKVFAPIKSSIYLKKSTLNISNSMISNSAIAIKSDSSEVDILNCNFIDNEIINILNKFSTIDFKNNIVYGSTSSGDINSYDNGIFLESYNQIGQFPYFLDENFHLDPDLSPGVDSGDPNLSDECIPPGLNGIVSDIGMYGGPKNCGNLESNVPDGKPIIDNIVDIPQDQGGFIGIQYQASGYENILPIHDIVRYSFWRDLNTDPRNLDSISSIPTSQIWTNGREYWEYIGDMVAQGFNEYGYTAPTLADSNLEGQFLSTFLVIAHTSNSDIYFVSDPASGESIDNLAPLTPMMLSGDFDSGEISLVWSNFVDEDFSYFNLYRNEELYSTVLDSQYVDLEVPNIPELFYSVSAVDHNGNESPVSQEIMVQAHLMGDLNDDFQLNILDVVGLMEYILGFYEIEDLTYADLNEDSNVDILDVIRLVTIILDENGM